MMIAGNAIVSVIIWAIIWIAGGSLIIFLTNFYLKKIKVTKKNFPGYIYTIPVAIAIIWCFFMIAYTGIQPGRGTKADWDPDVEKKKVERVEGLKSLREVLESSS